MYKDKQDINRYILDNMYIIQARGTEASGERKTQKIQGAE